MSPYCGHVRGSGSGPRADLSCGQGDHLCHLWDKEGRLHGILSLHELLLAEDTLKTSTIMRQNPVLAYAHWPLGEASDLIGHYDLLALPVLDRNEKMIGIVTVDDAMNIEKQEDATS